MTLIALAALASVPLVSAGWIWDDDSYVTANAVVQSPGGWIDAWILGRTP